MGLHAPRGKFERLDVVMGGRIWRTEGRADSAIAAVCRNLSARGCRLAVEDARLCPGLDVDSPIQFSIQLDPVRHTGGGGRVAWIKRERGEAGKIRLILGVEFTSVSFSDREWIKAYIQSRVQPEEQP